MPMPAVRIFHPDGRIDADYPPVKGITLREYFAGRAMQSLVANLSMGAEIARIFDTNNKIANAGSPGEGPQEYLARVAIAQADALLAELAKEGKV